MKITAELYCKCGISKKIGLCDLDDDQAFLTTVTPVSLIQKIAESGWSRRRDVAEKGGVNITYSCRRCSGNQAVTNA